MSAPLHCVCTLGLAVTMVTSPASFLDTLVCLLIVGVKNTKKYDFKRYAEAKWMEKGKGKYSYSVVLPLRAAKFLLLCPLNFLNSSS